MPTAVCIAGVDGPKVMSGPAGAWAAAAATPGPTAAAQAKAMVARRRTVVRDLVGIPGMTRARGERGLQRPVTHEIGGTERPSDFAGHALVHPSTGDARRLRTAACPENPSRSPGPWRGACPPAAPA